MTIDIPEKAYGILQQNRADSEFDVVIEQIKNIGYATIESGFSKSKLENFSNIFDTTYNAYVSSYGESYLTAIDELYSIRAPLTFADNIFLELALNKNLLTILRNLIQGKFILNQQNGVINPPKKNYNQGAWHRDLPYQHFVSTHPLAINALFCIDDFTYENGATFVLPASHKTEIFPSESYIKKNALQIQAKAGSFILLDCMLFHSGGFNHTNQQRRAINHVYNIPYFKQQINIPKNIKHTDLSFEEKEILGFYTIEPCSIDNYFSLRANKKTFNY